VETLVFEQRSDEELPGAVGRVEKQGEQPLLFLVEVTNGLVREEAKEGRGASPPRGCRALGSAAQLPCADKRVLMVVREGHERGVALHGRFKVRLPKNPVASDKIAEDLVAPRGRLGKRRGAHACVSASASRPAIFAEALINGVCSDPALR
jgi:hypothetical protein